MAFVENFPDEDVADANWTGTYTDLNNPGNYISTSTRNGGDKIVGCEDTPIANAATVRVTISAYQSGNEPGGTSKLSYVARINGVEVGTRAEYSFDTEEEVYAEWSAAPESGDELEIAWDFVDYTGVPSEMRVTKAKITVFDDGSGDVQELAGQVDGVSTVAGAMNVAYALAGTVVAAASVAGDLAVDHPMAGTVAAASTVSGTLSVVRNLAGVVAGVASLTGDMTRTDFIGPDSLRFYLSGAASDGGDQEAPADSLGGYRSSTEADRVGKLIVNLPLEIDLLQASRQNGVGGSGSIMVVDRNTLRYAAPGGSAGPPMAILDGETRVLVDGADPSKFVRVSRSGTDGIYGSGVLDLLDQRNNAFAMGDADDAEHTSGSAKYRCVFLLAFRAIDNLKLWIRPLGESAVSSGGVLGGSGSGTITSNTANAFVGWPWKGWAWISNAGTLREIVYYSSRTATTLTVPSLGRARLGTSAAAGNVADVVYPVPPYRIAWELASPAVGGPVQTIADEDTAPTGVTWSTAITAATGISVGALAASEQGGLWLHRELPAGVSASPIHDCRLGVQFDVLTTTYEETLAGLFRIADDSLDRYELRLGTNAPPALSAAPVATSPTLPITYSGLAVDGTEYHVAIDRRNAWDVVAQSIQATVIRTTDAGGVRPAPAAPYSITWQAGAGGVFTLTAFYSRYSDQIYDSTATPPRWIDNADAWLIYARYDGTDPDPSIDTPTVVAMVQVDNIESLTWASAAKTAGTVGKVIVRTRRSASVSGEDDDVESTNVDVYSATAATAGPSGNRLRGFQRRNAEIL